MLKKVCLLCCTLALLHPVAANAQLPANPWAAQSTSISPNQTPATVSNSSASAQTDIANPRLTPQATQSSAPSGWRGTGRFSQLGYTGEVTTYGKAQGQEMLAPEVNNHNMNVMIQHLRQLGYSIPASYDDGFNNFLQDYTSELRNAYSGLGRQNNPFDTMFNGMIDAFENFTGLDVSNIMFNSIDLIQQD